MKFIYDIDDRFEDFMRKIYPTVKETDRQWIECRRVFLAGVTSLYYAFVHEITLMSDEEGQQQLAHIEAQLKDYFLKRVKNHEEMDE